MDPAPQPEEDPYLDKRCRDFGWLLLLAAYSAGLLVILALAFARGNPAALLYPTDSAGNLCGWSPGYEAFRSVHYVFPSDLSRRICVTACPESFSLPSATTTSLAELTLCSPSFDARAQWGGCPATALRAVRYSAAEASAFASGAGAAPLERLRAACPATGASLQASFERGACGVPFRTVNVFGVCVPAVDPTGLSAVSPEAARPVYAALNDPGYRLLRYQSDLVAAYPVMLVTGLAGPAGLGRRGCCWRGGAGLLLPASAATLLASLAALSLLFFHRAGRLGGQDAATAASASLRAASLGVEPAALGAPDPTAELSRAAEGLGWACAALGALLGALCALLARRARVASGVAAEVAAALSALPRALLYPLATAAAQLLLWTCGAAVLLWLLGAGSHSNGGRGFEFDDPTRGAAIYLLLGLFWLALFLDGDAVKQPPVLGTLWRTLRLHAGSVALASLALYPLIALRAATGAIARRATAATGGPWRWAARGLRRCLAWHESHLQYLSRRAYVMMAIEGYGFWRSARDAHAVVAHYKGYVSPISNTADGLVLLAKVALATACGAGCCAWLTLDRAFDPTWGARPVASPLLPVLLVWVAAYSIASAVISVFAMATSVILFCACVDLDRNNGVDRPYYASHRLQQFLLDTQLAALRPRGNGKVYQVP
eukprot:tig00020943_g16321.t1